MTIAGFGDIVALLALREAIASVSLSHDDDCDCVVCRAAQGDDGAFAELLVAQLDP